MTTALEEKRGIFSEENLFCEGLDNIFSEGIVHIVPDWLPSLTINAAQWLVLPQQTIRNNLSSKNAFCQRLSG